jgi:phosphoglycolate phosphatase
MCKYKMVMFDLDGTIVDSFEFHKVSFQRFLQSFGVALSLDDIGKTIGATLKSILNGTLPQEKHEQALNGLSSFYKNDVDDLIDDLEIIDGSLHVLDYIKSQGVLTTLLTNSKHELVENVIKRKNMGQYFDDVKAADNQSLDKHTRCVKMLERFNVDACDALYVGDLSGDMKLAKQVGMDGCLIKNDYSWINREDIDLDTLDLTYCLSDIKDVISIIS